MVLFRMQLEDEGHFLQWSRLHVASDERGCIVPMCPSHYSTIILAISWMNQIICDLDLGMVPRGIGFDLRCVWKQDGFHGNVDPEI